MLSLRVREKVMRMCAFQRAGASASREKMGNIETTKRDVTSQPSKNGTGGARGYNTLSTMRERERERRARESEKKRKGGRSRR